MTQDLFLYQDPSQPIQTRVKDLISRMTLEEKVSQMICETFFMNHFCISVKLLRGNPDPVIPGILHEALFDTRMPPMKYHLVREGILLVISPFESAIQAPVL